MLRIHFGPRDAGRVRFARRAEPLWEVVLSLHALAGKSQDERSSDWRAGVARTAQRRDIDPHVARLAEICAGGHYIPDFLTPDLTGGSVESTIANVVATPLPVLRRDVEVFSDAVGPASPWLCRIGDGDPQALGELGASLTSYHQQILQPATARIRATVAHDRARRVEAGADNGIDGLFASFAPSFLRWNDPVLTVSGPDHDVYLEGRGLTLIPSYFCPDTAVTLDDHDRSPVLVYPAQRYRNRSRNYEAKLRALIGTTRTEILSEIAHAPGTTGELASRLERSASTISEHATTLREAGLITSTRRRNAVTHTATPRGRDLLRADSGRDVAEDDPTARARDAPLGSPRSRAERR